MRKRKTKILVKSLRFSRNKVRLPAPSSLPEPIAQREKSARDEQDNHLRECASFHRSKIYKLELQTESWRNLIKAESEKLLRAPSRCV